MSAATDGAGEAAAAAADSCIDPMAIACYILPLTVIVFLTLNQMLLRQELSPMLYYQKNSPLSQYLINNCKALYRPFKPQFWLANAHVQTVLTSVTELFYSSVELERELLQMEDGEQIAVDWVVSDTANNPKDILIILPGITGNPRGYLSLCKFCTDRKFRTALISKRGHGGVKLTLPKLRGFGDGTDLHCALKTIRNRYPDSRLAVIGSSAGSALLVAYVSQFKHDCLVDVAVGISPGYSGRKLFTEAPFPTFYHKVMLGKLKKRIVEPNIDVLCQAEGVDREKVLGAKTLNDLDTHLYSKVAGFKSVDEYWQHNDPAHSWGGFDCPFLCINSVDDPICIKELIPFKEFEKFPNCMLVATEKGGHCGFYESVGSMSWSFEVAIDYINTVFQYQASKASH